MNMEFFADALVEILSHSLVAPGKPLKWVIIANPDAGGFVMPKRQKQNLKALEACLALARANPLRERGCPALAAVRHETKSDLGLRGLALTKGPDEVVGIVKDVIDQANSDPESFFLVITAGGDGTHHGALTALYHAPDSVHSNIAVLRLPMGTGNDGADSPSLACALELLIKPSRIDFNPAIRLVPSGGGHATDGHSADFFLAFNILSVGLDAFVTHMTNKMKGKLPGDFYKLWVDIASLLYDSLYKVGFLDVKASNETGETASSDEVVQSFREKILLLAVGASGHRTYGSQKKILPDDRNVCALKQMSLFRKVALKDLFTTGKHIDKPEANMFSAHRVEISGEHPILAQMDGETVLLQKEDFPIVIELTEPVIPVLKPAE